jgi:beta-lactamase regulating signal transducer with metallopeptidase domain
MEIMQQPIVQALARALVHFLWQGAALALVTFSLVRLTRPTASVRYVIGVACLAAMAAMPVATTMVLARGSGATLMGPAMTVGVSTWASTPETATVATAGAPGPGVRARAVLVTLWLAGVMVLSVRLVGGWMLTRRLVARTRSLAAPEIRALARRVADRLALSRVVDVLESPTVSVPMMIGWIAPVVILPAAAMAALTPTQIEALLAHELAHVRRHDYLVNLLQSVVETLLFYHPAVWWVSRDVREAREHCCDDLAVAVCDRVVYASALADLAAMSVAPRFALAATDGSLAARVRRILGGGDLRRPVRPGWLAGAIVTLGTVVAVPIVALTSPTSPAGSTPQAASVPRVPIDTSTGEPVESRAAAVPDARPLGAVVEVRAEMPQVGDTDRARLVESPKADVLSWDKEAALRARLVAIQAELDGSQVPPDQMQALDAQARQLEAALERLQQLGDKTTELSKQQQEEIRALVEKLDAEVRAIKQAREDGDLPLKLKTLDGRMKEVTDASRKQVVDDSDQRLKELAQAAVANADLFAELKARTDRENFNTARDVEAELKARGDRGNFDGEAKLKARLADIEATDRARLDGFKAAKVQTIDPQLAVGLLDQAGKNDTVTVVRQTAGQGGGDHFTIKSVRWEEGLTAGQVAKKVGLPDSDVKLGVSRVLSLEVTWVDGDRRVTGRIEGVDLDAVLRAGDVLFVVGGGK